MAKWESVKVGDRYGRLKVSGPSIMSRVGSGQRVRFFPCLCDCGMQVYVIFKNLYTGNTKSCGCQQMVAATQKTAEKAKVANEREQRRREEARQARNEAGKDHGQSYTRLYGIWKNMRVRCSSPQCQEYQYYGRRGITVCDDWAKRFPPFYDWAMASGYREDLTIDRIDNSGNYEPSNCRWVNMTQQARNRRSNLHVTAWGETKILCEWIEDARCVVAGTRVRQRIALGWSPERALTTHVSR